MEFTAAEFVGGNRKKREQFRQYILKWVLQNSRAKLMGRQHVVKQENEFGLKKSIEWDSASKALDAHRGVLSHTVMFYDMTEPHAPVYENENQRHMFRFLLDEHAVRETWYYPESAYWVTFDNSVPLLLLPYLNARLADIDTCVRYAIPGHITFSSGWEWGYWLIDWSIARWSWSHRVNDTLMERYPSMYAREILGEDIAPLFDSLLRLQQIYLKDSILMQWMTAMTVTDELPFKKLAKMFHPRPALGYKYIRNKATLGELNQIKQNTLPLLNRFASTSLPYAFSLKNSCTSDTLGLCEEIAHGCEITALRALHRLNTLSHIIAKREGEIFKKRFKSTHFL
ncbi:MAG: hypothetical protein RMJ53_04370, partial [Chitinophagales bacterium]|nr:hypothetical protein [Chitinophagales bacterium]